VNSGFFGDDPVNGTSEAPDRLGRQPYAQHLVTLLARVSSTSESSVLAMIGPWGGGKSSILEMTLGMLRKHDGWRVAEFNPWAYADLGAMVVGFFEEILLALPEELRPKQTREAFAGWVQKMRWVGKVGGVVGMDLEGAIGGLGDLIEGDTSPSAQRRKMVDALAKANTRILMVLDDLDRLSPLELLLVFKLVRFVGRLPQVYYLLSYDEKTLLDVLARTELCGDSPARARDYLEKMVQIRLDLPPLREAQAAEMVRLGMEQLITSLGVTRTAEGAERFERAYASHFRERLTTPRAINRYLAQVDSLYTFLGEEVDFFDFAILTFIRTFEPTLYATLYRMRGELALTGPRTRATDDETDHKGRWRDLLNLAAVDPGYVDGVFDVLAELFLPVRAVRVEDPPAVDSAAVRKLADRKGVGHADYFDRYYGFVVPEDEISDAELRETLSLLDAADGSDPRVRKLALLLLTDTDRLIRKVSLRRPRDAVVTAALLRFFADHYDRLSQAASHDTLGERTTVRRLAAELLADVALNAPAVLADMSVTPGGILLATQLLVNGSVSIAPTAVAEQSRRIESFGLAHTATPFPDVPQELKDLIFAWREADRGACRSWLRGRVTAGDWDPLDVAGWQIGTALHDGVLVLDTFREGVVDELLGIEYLIQILGDRLDANNLRGPDFADTPADRRACALYALRQLRDVERREATRE
jgi:hypothetical protein